MLSFIGSKSAFCYSRSLGANPEGISYTGRLITAAMYASHPRHSGLMRLDVTPSGGSAAGNWPCSINWLKWSSAVLLRGALAVLEEERDMVDDMLKSPGHLRRFALALQDTIETVHNHQTKRRSRGMYENTNRARRPERNYHDAGHRYLCQFPPGNQPLTRPRRFPLKHIPVLAVLAACRCTKSTSAVYRCM